MTEDEFWEINAQSQTVSPGSNEELRKERIHRLYALLFPLPLEELNDYYYHFSKCYYGLYRYDVREAASIIDYDVYQSDDSFKDFRSWLISLGKEAYYSVSEDPDTLEQFITDNMENPYNPGDYYLQWEEFAYVATEVYYEKTGDDPPDDFGELHSSQAPEDIEQIMVDKDWEGHAGEWIDFDDKEALRREYPRTMARFGHLEHHTIQEDASEPRKSQEELLRETLEAVDRIVARSVALLAVPLTEDDIAAIRLSLEQMEVGDGISWEEYTAERRTPRKLRPPSEGADVSAIYAVRFSSVARAETDGIIAQITATFDESTAYRWDYALDNTIACLVTNPSLPSVAGVAEQELFRYEVRQILYNAEQRLSHRVFFAVRDTIPDGPQVWILHLRHSTGLTDGKKQ
jgi:plasmid stabilization system protein ParE